MSKRNKKNRRASYEQRPLFELSPVTSRKSIKQYEANERESIEIHVEDSSNTPVFPPLTMPIRWEVLEAETKKRDIPIRPLITPVTSGLEEMRAELARIRDTGMGRLMILSGVSGSGKTTFLNTLELFIDNVTVVSLKNISLQSQDDVEVALASLDRSKPGFHVVVLEGKEAPGSLKSQELDVLLTGLNKDFRRDTGRKTLVVIPTTNQQVAVQISSRAESIGGMTSLKRPFFGFSGPARQDYVRIADEMIRALNESRSLSEYGITSEIAKDIAESVDSIGAFLNSVYEEIQSRRRNLETKLAQIKRKRVHLWMFFVSDEPDATRNNGLIRGLTVGPGQHLQLARIMTGSSAELRYWETKKHQFAQVSQYLDIRIGYIPIRTVNALATAYGHDSLKDNLKELELIERPATRDAAQKSLLATALGAFLVKNEGFDDSDLTKRNRVTDRESEIFKEVVSLSKTDDLVLNAIIASCLRDLINDPETSVATELSVNDSGSLKADIAVVTSTDIYCIEMKWRSNQLTTGEIIRQILGRAKDFALELGELKQLLEK